MVRMIGAASLAALMAAVGLLLIGCSSSEDSADLSRAAAPAAMGMTVVSSMADAPAPVPTAVPLAQGAAGVPGLPGFPGQPGPSGQPGQPGAPASLGSDALRMLAGQGAPGGFDMASVQAAFVQQERIIVRTVDMELTVRNVAESVDAVAEIARRYSGWVVGADRSADHRGRVSIRVPAQSLEEAVVDVRGIGLEVESESTTSQDVTDEYVDSRSRLTSLRATEEALLALFEQAQTVEEALDVQRELADLQAEIEALLGRIKFLEETAAFSLINVGLSLAAVEMAVEAGDDRTLSVGEPARFRATFTPPVGIDTFNFVWDFGDGGEVAHGGRTVATSEPGQRVTATVHHTYADDLESPYIVSLDIVGFGDAGQVKGSDTFTVTVKEIPPIEVFLEAENNAEHGEDVEFSGSFTRPSELSDFKYSWDFGDGSPVVNGVPEDGVTRITAAHIYENYRNREYEITLTVTAQSEAGEVSGSSYTYIFVEEDEGLVIGGWSPGDNAKQATRALSVFGQGMGTLIIWTVIFSPAWLIVVGIVYGIIRLNRRRRDRRQAETSSGDPTEHNNGPRQRERDRRQAEPSEQRTESAEETQD